MGLFLLLSSKNTNTDFLLWDGERKNFHKKKVQNTQITYDSTEIAKKKSKVNFAETRLSRDVDRYKFHAVVCTPARR